MTPTRTLARRTSTQGRAIEARIRAELEGGRLGVAEVLRSERELAAEFDCSRRTVRRALQQLVASGYLVSRPRGGYAVASKPSAPHPAGTVAFVQGSRGTPWEWSEFNLAVWNGFQRAAAEAGRTTLAISIAGRAPAEMGRALVEQGVAGAVVDTDDPAVVDALLEAGLAAVPVDSAHPRVPSVTQDNFTAAFEAVRCLAGRGRRRVAFLGCDFSPNPNRLHLQERLGGYLAALDRLGLESRPEWRVLGRPVAPAVEQLVRACARPDGPDAAVVLWPDLLEGLGRAMAAGALRIDAVVWWGCVPERRERWRSQFPSLPVPDGLAWSAEEMARLALARMAEQLEGGRAVPGRTLCPARLVAGEPPRK
jgi:DNA-binding LacI/PurR family transcriptional regulator